MSDFEKLVLINFWFRIEIMTDLFRTDKDLGLQEFVTRTKQGWDALITDELVHEWSMLKSQLHQLENISVPRCFKPLGFGEALLKQTAPFL